jgi:EAL domain-containing protein (putative c-di-GMP-specific phosphodiesterase class I)
MLAFPESIDAPVGQTRRDAALRRRLQRDLRHAVAGDGLRMLFQPRRSLLDGALTGAEVQVRWPDRRGLPVTASALQADLALCEVVDWALRQACLCAAAWRYGMVAVPISVSQLRDGGAPRQVAAALEASGLAPDRLELMVPEPDLVGTGIDELLTLSALRDLGVGIVLDDFGGTIGSLMPLRRLPLTGLKLSRSLVRGAPEDREDAAILRALSGLAQSFGICAIADGVECETQRVFLAGLGCEEGQGGLMGGPLEAAAFSSML